MNGECCDGKYYHPQDDMGTVSCSYWKQEFNENEDSLCEICSEMGGPCELDDSDPYDLDEPDM